MPWEYIAALITLATFIGAIGRIIANNSKAMTQLKDSLYSLNETFNNLKKEVETNKTDIKDHEHRITVLETQD